MRASVLIVKLQRLIDAKKWSGHGANEVRVLTLRANEMSDDSMKRAAKVATKYDFADVTFEIKLWIAINTLVIILAIIGLLRPGH